MAQSSGWSWAIRQMVSGQAERREDQMVAERVGAVPSVAVIERELTEVPARIGVAAELEWLPAASLRVDHDHYQRPVRALDVQRIARDFDPSAFGVLTISERADGTRWVLDGQHRVAALLLLGWDNRLVPCLVERGLTLEEEATIFYKPQVTRRPLRPSEKFRAKLMAGDPTAVEIEACARRHGYSLALTSPSDHPRVLQGIASLEYIARNYPALGLDAVLAMADAVCGDEDQPSSMFLRGLAMFMYRARGLYDRARLIRVLQADRLARVDGDAKQSATAMNWSSEEGSAYQIHRRYNHGLQKRLPEWSDLRRRTVTTIE